MDTNPYKILGVLPTATAQEIKDSYRKLVKLHHPDTGVNSNKIISINAAWEILGNVSNRKEFDIKEARNRVSSEAFKERESRNEKATIYARKAKDNSSIEDAQISEWFSKVYNPIERLLIQIINPFPSKIKELSADPYDDILMESFCSYLKESERKMNKINSIYSSILSPKAIKNVSLNLYYCLSEVNDALKEFDRYTMGYVDNYLHDGKEMLREAKKKLNQLKEEKRHFPIQ